MGGAHRQLTQAALRPWQVAVHSRDHEPRVASVTHGPDAPNKHGRVHRFATGRHVGAGECERCPQDTAVLSEGHRLLGPPGGEATAFTS